MYRYSIFGLEVESGLEFPELLPGEGEPDIRIRWGEAPPSLGDPLMATERFQSRENELLLTFPDVGRLWVTCGRDILVDRFPGASEDSLRACVLGSALGAILHQRELLPLHASAIRYGDGCVLFCGRPGTGKSTIARFFIRQGGALLTDDICVIRCDGERQAIAYPSYPRMKLWADALEKFGADPTACVPYPSFPDKFIVPLGESCQSPLPVRCIFVLSGLKSEEVEITPVAGMEKFLVLKRQTYRRRFSWGMGKDGAHFSTASRIATQVPLFRVRRPKDLDRLAEVAAAMESIFEEVRSEDR